VFALIATGIVVAIYIRSQAEEARKRQEAEEQYRSSLREAETNYRQMLDALRVNPSDPKMREKALSWGRRFAELTRQAVGSGVTIYDEVALSNDINAACAGATRASQSGEPASIEERLARLKNLCDKGLISSEEYSEKRMRLLDEI
jgi:hypothetical protein